MTELISTKKVRKWRQKATMRLYQAGKELYQIAKSPLPSATQTKQILFIIGCQRSGTTLMTRIFERDLNAKVYPEHSVLSNQDDLDGLRLNAYPTVQDEIDKNRFPFIVLKPLVETQNSPDLLDYFKGSKALWMFRDYNDVALSNLRRFGMGNGIKNLRYIIEEREENWRLQGLAPEYRELVKKYFSEDMSPYDAAALFWIVRNSFFFDLDLVNHPDVRMLRYRDLVTDPLKAMGDVYKFVDQPFTGERLVNEVHQTSLGKGQRIEISPEISDLCDQMLARLDAAYEKQPEI